MSAVDTRNQYAKQDPTKQYPQPKFEEQTQSAPGLVQEMTPKPDHVPSTPPEASSRSGLAGTNNKLPNPSEALYQAIRFSIGSSLRCQTQVLLGDERLCWASMQRFQIEKIRFIGCCCSSHETERTNSINGCIRIAPVEILLRFHLGTSH
jgi:hypothetical protein